MVESLRSIGLSTDADGPVAVPGGVSVTASEMRRGRTWLESARDLRSVVCRGEGMSKDALDLGGV